MKAKYIIFILLIGISGFCFAKGGGGIEIISNAGSDNLPYFSDVFSDKYWLDEATGSIYGFGGFGYGVGRDHFKIGGFGYAFWGDGISKYIPEFDSTLAGMIGGFGGIILGSQYSVGPLVCSLNSRIGFGGLALKQYYGAGPVDSPDFDFGTMGVYLGLEAEAGILASPNMLLSVYGGASGIAALTFSEPLFLPLLVPVFGFRITWGAF